MVGRDESLEPGTRDVGSVACLKAHRFCSLFSRGRYFICRFVSLVRYNLKNKNAYIYAKNLLCIMRELSFGALGYLLTELGIVLFN